MNDLGVQVIVSTEVTPELCAEVAPDVAVVATGASVGPPVIAGSDKPHVLTVDFALRDGADIGARVVVLSGERAGLVAAEYLASEGRQVVVVEQGRRVATDVIATFKWRHYAWLKELGIEVVTSANVRSIVDEGVVVEDAQGNVTMISADTIVVAGPRRARQGLAASLEFVCDELYIIGDAVKPRSLHNAIRDGYLVGVKL